MWRHCLWLCGSLDLRCPLGPCGTLNHPHLVDQLSVPLAHLLPRAGVRERRPDVPALRHQDRQERARQEERGRQGEGARLPPAHNRHDTAHDRHHPRASEGAHADREQGIPGEADQGVGEQPP